VKKAPVDKQANVTEMFDTLIALKKVSQCMAMMSPAKRNPIKVLVGTFIGIFLNQTYSAIKPIAIDMRYHTKGKASSEIKAPKTAVNPQMNTMTWRCK
jgi:hypothetical protein